jgi:hypothetical protein
MQNNKERCSGYQQLRKNAKNAQTSFQCHENAKPFELLI